MITAMASGDDHLSDILFALMSVDGIDMIEVELMFDTLLEVRRLRFRNNSDAESFYDGINRKDIDRTIIKNLITNLIIKK